MDTPVKISTETIKRLRDSINANFNAFNEKGELDLDKCQRNVAYSAGNIYTTYNGLLMQEEQKLASIKQDLSKIKAMEYDYIKRHMVSYDIDSKGMVTLLEGDEKVRTKQNEYDNQVAYVDFIKRTVNQLCYYANAVKVIIEREQLKKRYE